MEIITQAELNARKLQITERFGQVSGQNQCELHKSGKHIVQTRSARKALADDAKKCYPDANAVVVVTANKPSIVTMRVGQESKSVKIVKLEGTAVYVPGIDQQPA